MKLVFYILADSVAGRMREAGFMGRGIQIYLRDIELRSFERQCQLSEPTHLAKEMVDAAMELAEKNYSFAIPLRSVGIRAMNILPDDCIQENLFDWERRDKIDRLEAIMHRVQNRYGPRSLHRAITAADPTMAGMSPKHDLIHTTAFYK